MISGSKSQTIAIEKLDLRVSYSVLDNFYESLLPKLINEKYRGKKPLAIIHVGVSGAATSVLFELNGFNEAKGRDVDGQVPADGKVIPSESLGKRRRTRLDSNRIIANTNTACQQRFSWLPNLTTSNDAGRYLCNYSYFKALYWISSRSTFTGTCFIHVPMENNPHSIEELSIIIQLIGENCSAETLGFKWKVRRTFEKLMRMIWM